MNKDKLIKIRLLVNQIFDILIDEPALVTQKTFSSMEEYWESDEWKAKRKLVRERCNGVCEVCKENKMFATHHLTYNNLYNEPLEDLQGVCKDCHDIIHGKIEMKVNDNLKENNFDKIKLVIKNGELNETPKNLMEDFYKISCGSPRLKREKEIFEQSEKIFFSDHRISFSIGLINGMFVDDMTKCSSLYVIKRLIKELFNLSRDVFIYQSQRKELKKISKNKPNYHEIVISSLD